MPTSVSHNPAAPHSYGTPTISAKGNLVTGSGFLPDHNVAIRITRAGEDIDDYLAYVTDGHGLPPFRATQQRHGHVVHRRNRPPSRS
jgi:hypothetical protein